MTEEASGGSISAPTMSAPAFFVPGTRRVENAWMDWEAVNAFLHREILCRVVVNGDPFPLSAGTAYEFDGQSFTLIVPRGAPLAVALAKNANCTISVDQSVAEYKAQVALDPEAMHLSVVARCTVSLNAIDLEPDQSDRRSKQIYFCRASVIELSGQRWKIDPTTEG